MDRKIFEQDLLELLKKHKFIHKRITKVRIEVEAGGAFLVNVECKQQIQGGKKWKNRYKE